MRHQLVHSTSTPPIMYWTLMSNNLRYISENGQIVRQPPKVDISNRLDPCDGSIDESMVLWFREGLLNDTESESLLLLLAQCSVRIHTPGTSMISPQDALLMELAIDDTRLYDSQRERARHVCQLGAVHANTVIMLKH